MAAHEISHENWHFCWIYFNIDKPTTSDYLKILYCPIAYRKVISPAQIEYSRSTISNKVYWIGVLLSNLLLFFWESRISLKWFFYKAGHFVEYRRFRCQYLGRWNNYWNDLLDNNVLQILFWRGRFIHVGIKSTKVSIFMPIFREQISISL